MLTPFSYLSPVIRKLIIINSAIFLIGMILPSINLIIMNLFGLEPRMLFDFSAETLFGKPWSIFTYMFLHGSFFHLFANMFFGLWMFGDSIAKQIGDAEFTKLYLIAGTFAGLLSAVVYNVTGVNTMVIGASGATYAVMYLFCKYNPDATVLFMFIIPMRVKTLFIVLLVVEGVGAVKNIVPGFTSDGIAHITHLFGLLGGFLYLKFLYKGYGFKSFGTRKKESPFSSFTEKVKQAFQSTESTQTKEREYDIHSPHGSNEMLDTILKKVSDYGIHSLSEKEKLYLEKVSEQRRKQKGAGNIHRMDDYK